MGGRRKGSAFYSGSTRTRFTTSANDSAQISSESPAGLNFRTYKSASFQFLDSESMYCRSERLSTVERGVTEKP